jgi:soluble lytic murein transglycosylase
MSSMVRTALITALLASAVAFPAPVLAQWSQGRDGLVAQQPTQASYAVSRWEQLTASATYAFDDYAGFLLTYPGFPTRTCCAAMPKPGSPTSMSPPTG